jgi:predicted histone-like DNA-binding protein
MAITFKISRRAQPGVKGGGKNKYCAIPYQREMVDTNELYKDIEMISNVSDANVAAVVRALRRSILQNLLSGRSIRVEGLGIFSVSFKVDMKNSAQEVKPSSIKEVRLAFRPEVELKKELQNAKFVKHYERKNPAKN